MRLIVATRLLLVDSPFVTMMPEDSAGTRKVYKDHNLHVLFGVTLMAVLGVSSITPALPEIRDAFSVTSAQVGLLITIFTLPGIALTPVLGVLSDRLGRRKILIPALFLFGIAGGLCAFARGFELLLALRLLQRMGAAALGTLNVTVIGDIFTGHERSAALGYNSSVLSIGTASYPAIGGALATLGWFYPFALAFLAIHVGLLVLFQTRENLAEVLPEALVVVGLRVVEGGDREVLGLLGVSLLTFIILLGPQLTFLPILMDERFGAPSFLRGAVLSGASLTTALTSARLGALTSRVNERTLLEIAFVLYVAGLALVALVPNVWLLLVPAVLFGVAQGINLPNVFSLLNAHAPSENRGAFMAANGMSLRAGQTIGPLLMAATVGILGLTGAYLAATALAVVALLLVITLLR
jgi:MFS transporter, ACDE family, multidrug resistance protein